MASNPEFLREGAAINDFMRPDRVVMGVDSPAAEEILKAIYRPLYLIETPFVVTTIETAELIKYAANAFLATKISFINEIANLCEEIGANVQDVARVSGWMAASAASSSTPGRVMVVRVFPRTPTPCCVLPRKTGWPAASWRRWWKSMPRRRRAWYEKSALPWAATKPARPSRCSA